MSTTKSILFAAAMISLSISVSASPDIAKRIKELDNGHPRIMLNRKSEVRMWRRIKSDPTLCAAAQSLVGAAEGMIDLPTLEHVKIGKRLLSVSRTCLKRVLYLSMAYRLTGDDRFLKRAEAEMLKVARFDDWNPSHFLDVAEMTMALAIGYDWLYDDLSDESRAAIRGAIVDFGLRKSYQGRQWWLDSDNNWNQVCNAGMVLGALAVMEDYPQLSTEVIERALQKLPKAMREYAPDGGYPEGPGYWLYGTEFNVVLIDALQSVFGVDFGLTGQKGFMDTADYYLHSIGPSGLHFNYSDGGAQVGFSVAMYWFEKRLAKPYLIWFEERQLESLMGSGLKAGGSADRLFPLLLLWRVANPVVEPPSKLSLCVHGDNPVAFQRTSWSKPNAVYAAIKGGSPSANHGHMDIGTFVLDAGGVRWASDLGAQNYNSLESKGLNIWNKRQGSDRWKVFRYVNTSHNTLVVNGAPQIVSAFAPIDGFVVDKSGFETAVDMSAVYADQLRSAARVLRLSQSGRVRIEDQLQTGDQSASIRWGMLTRADIIDLKGNQAILRRAGKRLRLRLVEPENASFQIYETDAPPNDYDARNPGTKMIGFSVNVEADKKIGLIVEMRLLNSE